MTTSRPIDLGPHQVARRVTVAASARELYDIVCDPHRHHELDGSGTVGSSVTGPRRLAVGDRFTVAMRQFGVPYKITSIVTRAEPYTVVEWRHPGGHHWRWELSSLDEDHTEVTEVFDYREARSRVTLRLMRAPTANDRGIGATLDGLVRRHAEGAPSA